jgi:hypothetical protein
MQVYADNGNFCVVLRAYALDLNKHKRIFACLLQAKLTALSNFLLPVFNKKQQNVRPEHRART